MDDVDLNLLIRVITPIENLAFAYLFGSRAGKTARPSSDIDLGLYFTKDPDLEMIYELTESLNKAFGHERVDVVVLNNCNDFVLRSEVLRGKMVLCRDKNLHATFFSWTLRMAEDEKWHSVSGKNKMVAPVLSQPQ